MFCTLAEKPGPSNAEQLDDCIVFGDSDHGDDEDDEEDDPFMRRLRQQDEEEDPVIRRLLQNDEESKKENMKPVSQKKTEKQSKGKYPRTLNNYFCYVYIVGSLKSTVELFAIQFERKSALKEKELELKKMELEFQKKKWELEEEERRQRLRLDSEQQLAIIELLKKK